MQFSISQTELKDQLNVVAGDTLISDTMVKRWLNIAMKWALTFKRWPFLEKKYTDLIDSTGTYPYQSGMKTKSCRLITVAGKRFDKIRYEDYLKYLEDNSTGTDKIWAEFDRDIFINGNACTVGEAIIMFAIEQVADLSGDTDTSPFSTAEESGDLAIIKYAKSLGLKKIGGYETEARLEEAEAKDILNDIWQRLEESAPREVNKNTPRMKKIDILNGTRT